MKIKCVFVSLLIFTTTILFSQKTKKIWDKTNGGLGTDGGSFIHHNTINGKIFVFGSFSNSNPDPKDLVTCTQYGKKDFIILCYDSTGKKIWDLSIGGSDDDGESNKVIPVNDGYEIFLLSKSNNTGIIGSNPCNIGSQIVYFKIDFNGNISFTNSFCVDQYNIDKIFDIKKFSTGNYGFLIQISEGSGNPPETAYFNVNSSMGLVSQNILQTSYYLSYSCSNIVEESNGGYTILISYNYDNANCPTSNSEPASCARIINFDSNNKILKQKLFYSIKSQTDAVGLLKKNGEYYLLMSSEPSITLSKDVIGLCTSESKYLRNMTKAPAKNLSQYNKDLWLLKLSSAYQVLAEKSYGTNGLIIPNSFEFKEDSTLLIGCTTNGSNSFDKIKATNGGLEYWGLNLKHDLTLLSENSFGAGSTEDLYSFTADWQGNYYTGYSKSDKGGDKSEITRGDWDIWSVVECVQPIASFSVAPKDTSIIAGSLVKFTNNSTSCNRYKWDFGDGSYSYSKDPVHYFNGIGKYHVKLWVANAFCSDSLTISNLINVVKYVGIEQHEAESMINVYPNPFAGMVNIDVQNVFETITIDVYSTIGQGILHETGFHGGQIDLSNQPNGMYYLTITGEKFSLTKKIFKNE